MDLENLKLLARQIADLSDATTKLIAERDRMRDALREVVESIEDSFDCDLQGEDWKCTVTYDHRMLQIAKRALGKSAPVGDFVR